MKKSDLVGQRFGKLIVVNEKIELRTSPNQKIKWVCKCDCGKEIVTTNDILKKGKTSCGCIYKRDLVGARFGKLVVLSLAGRKYSRDLWLCQCDCGKETKVVTNNLDSGQSSCGCVHPIKHGMCNSLTYQSWAAMLSRCRNKNSSDYTNYGGRGITVYAGWVGKDGFQNFVKDAGLRPSKEYTLDRYPNNDGNYEPGNVRWGTDEQQNRNKRNNLWFEFSGIRLIAKDWELRWGLSHNMIQRQIKRGKTFEDIFKENENGYNNINQSKSPEL